MSIYNPTEVADLEERVVELAQETETYRRLVDYNTAMLMAFEELSTSYQNENGNIAASKANMVLSAAMESLGANSTHHQYDNLTLEEIDRLKGDFFDRISKSISLALKNYIDNIQTFLTLYNMQTSRLQKLKRSLAQVENNATVTIDVSHSKYMSYGNEKTVEDADTYIKEFTKMAKVMTDFCSVASDLNDESKFNVASYIGSKVTFRGDEFVIDHFKRMHELVSKVISTNHLKKEISKNYVDVFATEPMIGMSQVVALMPKPKDIKDLDYLAARDAVRYVYLSIDRTKKFSFESDARSIKLTFTKKQIETLVNESEALLKEANKLLSFTKKFNSVMDSVIADIVAPSGTFFRKIWLISTAMAYKTNPEAGGGMPSSFLPAIRIIMRYMNMTYDCTAGGYNFSLGNIKKALTITESFIRQAD